jgi:hypothetical protein
MAMSTNLLNALKEIVSQHGGVETLANAQRVKALLADLAATEPRPQKNAIIACIELGFVSLLQNVPAEEQGAAKARLAERLNREEGLAPDLCAGTLDMLEAVLSNNADTQPEEQEMPQITVHDTTDQQSDSVAEFEVSGENTEIAALTADIERLAKERDQSNDENRKVTESLKK